MNFKRSKVLEMGNFDNGKLATLHSNDKFKNSKEDGLESAKYIEDNRLSSENGSRQCYLSRPVWLEDAKKPLR